MKLTSAEKYAAMKTEAIKRVTGGKVACQVCGFNKIRALQFDHITNVNRGQNKLGLAKTGTPERGGVSMVRAINDGRQDVRHLQVLCANCHCLKGTN